MDANQAAKEAQDASMTTPNSPKALEAREGRNTDNCKQSRCSCCCEAHRHHKPTRFGFERMPSVGWAGLSWAGAAAG
jgi:hypothetical protein